MSTSSERWVKQIIRLKGLCSARDSKNRNKRARPVPRSNRDHWASTWDNTDATTGTPNSSPARKAASDAIGCTVCMISGFHSWANSRTRGTNRRLNRNRRNNVDTDRLRRFEPTGNNPTVLGDANSSFSGWPLTMVTSCPRCISPLLSCAQYRGPPPAPFACDSTTIRTFTDATTTRVNKIG
jgi:hypothetical protein